MKSVVRSKKCHEKKVFKKLRPRLDKSESVESKKVFKKLRRRLDSDKTKSVEFKKLFKKLESKELFKKLIKKLESKEVFKKPRKTESVMESKSKKPMDSDSSEESDSDTSVESDEEKMVKESDSDTSVESDEEKMVKESDSDTSIESDEEKMVKSDEEKMVKSDAQKYLDKYLDDAKKAKVYVWWDLDNLTILDNVSSDQIQPNIRSALQLMGFRGTISIVAAYVGTDTIPESVKNYVKSAGISVKTCRPGEKHVTMIVDMLLWSYDNPPPANYLLISDDWDLSYAMSELQMVGYEILFALSPSSVSHCCLAADYNWLWPSLLSGKSALSEKELLQILRIDSDKTKSVVESKKVCTLLDSDKTDRKSVVESKKYGIASSSVVESKKYGAKVSKKPRMPLGLTISSSKMDEKLEEEFKKAKVSVWWDLKNWDPYRHSDPNKVGHNISLELKQINYCGPVSIFCEGDTTQIPYSLQLSLRTGGISDLKHYIPVLKDVVYKNIIVDMLHWARSNPPPANILFILGDVRISYVIQRLQERGYNVLSVGESQQQLGDSSLLLSSET